jgi:hypothetical protein
LPQQQNLKFLCWDYSKTKDKPVLEADILVSSLGIDFVTRNEHWSLDAGSLRASAGYRSTLSELRPYLECWRAVAKNRARLFVVLRIPSADSLLAFADAAQMSGWTLNLAESTKIDGAHEGKLPALSLVAEETNERLTEDDIVSWYAFTEDKTGPDGPLQGAKAIAFYRSIAPKRILARGSMKYDDGHEVAAELGTAGSLAYLFVRATNGGAELQLTGTTQAETLRPSEAWGLTLNNA